MKLRKGDTVKVLIGKDKGKTSKIERIFPRVKKVVVDGVNQYKRHVKGKGGQQGSEIITLTKPLPVSNVALVCPHCKKATRVGYEVSGKEKARICRKCKKKI